MKKIINSKYMAILLLILWLLVIFYFSSKGIKESHSTSYKIVDVIVPIIDNGNSTPKERKELREDVNYYLRKTAHFTEYAVLGVLSFNVLRFYDLKKRKRIIYALIFCMIYATSDEIHQIFSNGRSPMVTDILIDSSGSLFGILIFSRVLNIRHNKVK